MTIDEFLLARDDEREQVAKAAAARVRRWEKATRPPWVRAREFAAEERYAALEAFEGRETPDEVLADLSAKRKQPVALPLEPDQEQELVRELTLA